MANQTVYPYGTEGSLPSSIGIVNDPITGGADKAFSAEEGKQLNQRLCYSFDVTGRWKIYDGFFSETNYIPSGQTTRKFGAVSNDGYDYIRVVAEGGHGAFIAFVKSIVPDLNEETPIDFCVGTQRIKVDSGEDKMYYVPEDCVQILVSILNIDTNYLPRSVYVINQGEISKTASDNYVPVAFSIVDGAYDTKTGILGSSFPKRCTSIIDVSEYDFIKVLFNDINTVSPFWYDADGIYLGRDRAVVIDGSAVEIEVPKFAKKVAFTISLDGGDVSDARIWGRRTFELESETDGTEVFLSDFWNTNQTDGQNVADMFSFVSGFAKKVVHIDKDITIDSAILLESNTTVYIDGVKIKQANLTFDNVFRSANLVLPNPPDYKTMPSEIPVLENIRIIGSGAATIEGPDINRTDSGGNEMVGDAYGLRTWQICLVRVNGGEVSGLLFTKTRNWALECELVSNIVLHHLWFVTTVKNGDGINFRVGCKHCSVHDIYGYTRDDLIACTALGNLEYSDEGRTYVGTPTWKLWNDLVQDDPEALYIDDIVVRRVTFMAYQLNGNGGHGLICLSAYGSKVQNVSVTDFYEVAGADSTEGVIKIYHGYGSGYTTGDLNSIRIDNAIARNSTYVLLVTGGVVANVWGNNLRNTTTPANVYSESTGNSITVTNS